MTIFIDELIKKLIEIRNDGYSYCDIDILPEDELDDEIIPSAIMFSAVDEGGDVGIDYIRGEEVCEVTDDELEKFAYRNRKPAPNRKPIKKIIIEDC